MIDLVVAAGTARFGAFPVTARVAGINKVTVCACRHIVRRIDFRTGFGNALVVRALLIAGTLAVGRTISRNRRTGIARAVGTRGSAVFRVSRRAGCRISLFCARFDGTRIADALFV